MNEPRRSLYFVFLAVTLFAGNSRAQLPGQPYSSYWFPDELLSWSPSSDSDAAYNRGSIELADRFVGDSQANPHAHPGEADISCLSIMYPSTSGNPSQGANIFNTYRQTTGCRRCKTKIFKFIEELCCLGIANTSVTIGNNSFKPFLR